jgi:hypothetical protein
MPWGHIGEWRYSSTIPGLGTRWRWVVSFTFQPLYLQGKSSSTYCTRGCVAPEPVWTLWSRAKFLSPARNWIPAIQLIAHFYIDWAVSAHRTNATHCTYLMMISIFMTMLHQVTHPGNRPHCHTNWGGGGGEEESTPSVNPSTKWRSISHHWRTEQKLALARFRA